MGYLEQLQTWRTLLTLLNMSLLQQPQILRVADSATPIS